MFIEENAFKIPYVKRWSFFLGLNILMIDLYTNDDLFVFIMWISIQVVILNRPLITSATDKCMLRQSNFDQIKISLFS